MRTLWPPIGVIESRLQPGKNDVLHLPALQLEQEPGTAAPAEMPAFIRDKVNKRVAARQANFDPQPAAGKIMRFDGADDESAPLCVLLDREGKPGIWHGWIAAAETDYATNRDVLLEPQDEPFDPVAGMVQTWNPVEVDAGKAARVLAQLGGARMDAIREVARGECEGGGDAKPGFVAPLAARSSSKVLAGTRISDSGDIRDSYQSLYRAAAYRLQQVHQTTAKVVPFPAKQPWRNAGWAIAASIVLAQSIVIANLWHGGQDSSVNARMEQVSEYRSTPVPQAAYIYVEVYFKPDAKEIDIRKLLTRLNATIVDGPGQFGQWRLKMKAAGVEAKTLKESGLVDSVKVEDDKSNYAGTRGQ